MKAEISEINMAHEEKGIFTCIHWCTYMIANIIKYTFAKYIQVLADDF